MATFHSEVRGVKSLPTRGTAKVGEKVRPHGYAVKPNVKEVSGIKETLKKSIEQNP